MPKTPTPTRAISQALQGRGRHSSLYWWMYENFAELKEAKGSNRTDWKSLVVELTRLGLTDIHDRPPTTEIARKTWDRVVKDIAAKPQPKPLPTPQPKPALRPIEKPAPIPQPMSSTGNSPFDDFLDQINKR